MPKTKRKDKRKRPRFIQMLKAKIGGYFWMPCDICGEDFGGHEKPSGSLYEEYKDTSKEGVFMKGVIVCANCIEEAEGRNIELRKTVDPKFKFFMENHYKTNKTI